MAARFCVSCGSELGADSRFCTSCGRTVEAADQTASRTPSTEGTHLRAPVQPPSPPNQASEGMKSFLSGIGIGCGCIVGAIVAVMIIIAVLVIIAAASLQ